MSITDRGPVAAAVADTVAPPRGGRPARRLARGLAAAVLSAGLALGAAGCGFDVQTLQPYTPSEGVNTDVGTTENRLPAVKVRGLMVVATDDDQGFLSAALYAPEQPDRLVDVSGFALGTGGEAGPPLTTQVPPDLTVAPQDGAVVLVEQRAAVTLQGEGLVAGRTAELTLTFERAGAVTLVVPVVAIADYENLTPPGTPPATPGQGA
ncbi:hypothetical protein GC722_12270 [Auraticoccus sp. F435]|uniref:Copper chaperone PCu(A)C n=1 Tax=Auraticoccus cholistanensis TaxID=2656650 RepID=A0A6A9UVP8_9ACTN|nr:hypothetical protein [Auraticoccus cholistanensis]MVA76791.1 hypothetical protein [Auraticoccus cholistanensis]